MADETALDTAHAAMQAAPEDETARLRFFERLADAELFLLLQSEPEGDQLEPEVFELSDHSFVLVFDREDRLAEFTGRVSPYVALSGRAIAGMLATSGAGLGVNLDVAPSSTLLPPEAVSWLSQMLEARPDETREGIAALAPPTGLPEELVVALDRKLATAAGLAASAYLVGVSYDSGAQGHMLGIVDAVPGAEGALAQAVSEVLTFSGLEAAMLDVAFFKASDPAAPGLARHGLRFDLPMPEVPANTGPSAPGMDPDRPPILK